MKLKCTQENLAKGLSIVGKAVSIKASLPILGNVLITAKSGNFALTSSNLETSIFTTVNASVETEGAAAVPAKLFNEFISSLAPGTVELSLTGNSLKISSGGSTAKLTCMPAEDFPAMPKVKKGVGVNLSSKELGVAVASTGFCAAIGDSRPSLTGILLKKENTNLTVVATDGYRLSETAVPILKETTETENFSLLVPAKTVSEVARTFSSLDETIKLTYGESENLAVFECGNVLIAIRVLDGEFPDYKRIIPANHVLWARSKTSELTQALKVINVFAKEAKEGNNLLRISLDPSGKCEISSSSDQSGEGSVEIKMEVDSKEKMVLAFNSKYLLDFFNNVKSEDIDIYSGGESSPCVFKIPDFENFLHLIMPVKIN